MTQDEEILIQMNSLVLLRNAGQWNDILQKRYDQLEVMRKLRQGHEQYTERNY